MPNYECSTCDYCDKNRKQGNKVRCIRFSKFVEGLSICKECHHPHGWCGLKFRYPQILARSGRSPPTRVVWIEILRQLLCQSSQFVTTHTGGVD